MQNPDEAISATHTANEPQSTQRRNRPPIRVIVPDEPPELTPKAARILLDILMELKEKADQQNRTDPDEHTKKID
jgi:hypothetical protein